MIADEMDPQAQFLVRGSDIASPRDRDVEASPSTFGETGCFGGSSQLNSESVLELYGKWHPPDDEKARQKYHAAHLQHETFDPKTADVKDFKEFGAGHLLYFYWVRTMMYVFVILAIFPAIPMLIIYIGGDFLSSNSSIETTTIGNYGLPSSNANQGGLNISLPTTNSGADAELVIAAYFQDQADQPPVLMSGLKFNKLNALIAASVMDFFGILFFFGACIYFNIKTKHMSEKVDEQVVSLPEYSLAVAGLPSDTTSEELRKYFEQWGEVVQVECARKCNLLISMVLERRKVLDELDLATAVLQRSASLVPTVDEDLEIEVLNAKYDLSLLTEAIKACQAMQAGNDVVRGYVTFLNDVGRDAALAAQPKGQVAKWRQPAEQRFRGKYRLDVSIAPQATDIYFENLEFSSIYRFLTRSLTWSLKALLVFVGFLLVSTAPSIQRNVNSGGGPGTDICESTCSIRDANGRLSLTDSLRDTYKLCYDTGTYSNGVSCQSISICYECFCRAALGASQYGEATYCKAFNNVLLLAAGAQALTVVTIVMVNMSVKALIHWFTSFEKHRTRTRESLSKLTALFVTMFINSAFSIIIANMYMPNVNGSLSSTWQKILFGGIYSDTTPNWYRDVGKALIVSHLITTVVRAASIGFDIAMSKWGWSRRSKALTQWQLDACYEGHAFELAERYGELLASIFTGLLFSASMPLMYWSLAFSFSVSYYLEKYELLRVCKWPISYSGHMGELVARILPWAALWHMLGAVWMISMIGTPRSPLFGDSFAFSAIRSICFGLKRVWSNTNKLTPDVMAARLTNKGVGHMLWGFILLGIGLFVAYTWRFWYKCYMIVQRKLAAARALTEQKIEEAKAKAEKKRKQDAGEEDDEEDDEDDTVRPFERQLTPTIPEAAPAPVLALGEPLTQGDSTAPAHSVPEFPLALRSKLLVGPETYEMRKNPNYVHAFERLDDVLLNNEEFSKIEKNQHHQTKFVLPSARAERRRLRREAAQQALLKESGRLKKLGMEGQHLKRLQAMEDAANAAEQERKLQSTFGSPRVHPTPWAGSDEPLGSTMASASAAADRLPKKDRHSPAPAVGGRTESQTSAFATQYVGQAIVAHGGLGDHYSRAHGARLAP